MYVSARIGLSLEIVVLIRQVRCGFQSGRRFSSPSLPSSAIPRCSISHSTLLQPSLLWRSSTSFADHVRPLIRLSRDSPIMKLTL